jgi:hypothetical protein
MSIRVYLPSSNFSTIVGSIGCAALLVGTAHYFTNPPSPSAARILTTPTAVPETPETDWRTQLEEIAINAAAFPEAPSADKVDEFLAAAASSNVTDTVARSLLINLSSAGAQGLGSDIPTQEQLIATAIKQLPPTQPEKTYVRNDLLLVEASAQSLRKYGNDVMVVLGRHTTATSDAVLVAVSNATDNNDPSALKPLTHIGAEYEALTEELAQIAVPKTLAPLHVQALNDLGKVAVALDDLQQLFEDPLRGLQALQHYQFMLGEVGRVFTSIAESFDTNGILFSKDEPGAAWSVLVSADLQ